MAKIVAAPGGKPGRGGPAQASPGRRPVPIGIAGGPAATQPGESLRGGSEVRPGSRGAVSPGRGGSREPGRHVAPLEAARRGPGRGWEAGRRWGLFSAAAGRKRWPGRRRDRAARLLAGLRTSPGRCGAVGRGASALPGSPPSRPSSPRPVLLTPPPPPGSREVSSCRREMRPDIRTREALSGPGPPASSGVLDRINLTLKKIDCLTTRFVLGWQVTF